MSEKNASQEEAKRFALSRRGFLKAASLAAAAVGFVKTTEIGLAQQENGTEAPSPMNMSIGTEGESTVFPYAPQELPPSNVLTFFTPNEIQAVKAMTARIIPGTPADPGAREAGVANYIDKTLGLTAGFSQPTYRKPPFAQTYSGDQPPT